MHPGQSNHAVSPLLIVQLSGQGNEITWTQYNPHGWKDLYLMFSF